MNRANSVVLLLLAVATLLASIARACCNTTGDIGGMSKMSMILVKVENIAKGKNYNFEY
jgi:hypothetical protein